MSPLLLVCCGSARAGWVAYNDCLWENGDTTVAQVTEWTIHNNNQNQATGRLKDFQSGSEMGMPMVTFTMGSAGLSVSNGGAGGNPQPGTEAYELFHGFIDFGPNTLYYGQTQYGGAVDHAAHLTVTGIGQLYYTLDGVDPRLPGGTIHPQARRVTDAVVLSQSSLVKLPLSYKIWRVSPKPMGWNYR